MGTTANKSSSVLEVWAYGVVTVIGGQLFAWNVGLVAGTISYGLGVFIIGMAYLCMVLSTAEVASVVAFRGGVYGLARCTLGFYFGFMVGCCELLEYSLFAASNSILVSQILSGLWPALLPYALWLSLANQVVSFGLVMLGGRVFWRFILFFAVLILAILLLYYFTTMTFASATVYAGGMDTAFLGGLSGFFTALPQATWMFSGVEAITTLGNDLTDPKRLIPRGQVLTMCTLLVTACCTFAVAICMPPGGINVATTVAVMNGVFSTAFSISDATATVLTLPSVLFTAAAFALPASNILVAMAQSKLMPSKLATVHPRLHTNTNALLVIFAVSSVICPVFLYTELFSSIAYSMSLVFGLFSYSAQCAGFVYLRRHHHHMKRSFVNPVGIPGAVFAMIVFGLCMISVLFCQDDDYIVLIGTTAIVVVLSAHYHIYSKHRQTLSDDEHALFFAHVAKFNEKTKQSQATSTSASTWHFVGLFSTGHRVVRKIQVKPTSNSY
ncbi:hypothetical protein LEN26_008023 [Aphanomyces euteiches]|nr:hypothetical protein AeMF1_009660 [Aphanomyces euteiches]KAH9130999.1 hypothetical protein LEN26_008023 [Aphanomyces euteiches]